jgi:hypothetical protein
VADRQTDDGSARTAERFVYGFSENLRPIDVPAFAEVKAPSAGRPAEAEIGPFDGVISGKLQVNIAAVVKGAAR